VIDMTQLGERTIWLDCDVLQADGGTRTASITGAYVALHLALQHLIQQGAFSSVPLTDSVAAVSLGIFQGVPYLDLNYEEDSTSEADLNIVMTGRGALVEIQGTAERQPFTQEGLLQTLTLARHGIEQLIAAQHTALVLP
jgi:ribonuclease PH